jgi:hypothetical protein
MTETWEQRIVGHAEVDPATLKAHPGNWRVHPTKQRSAMGDVLGDLGWIQGILVNQRSGYVLDGHMRLDMAVRTGQATVPVTYVDLSDEEEMRVLATLNPLGALAGTDEGKRAALRELMHTERESLRLLAGFAAESQEPAEDDDRAALVHDHTAAIVAGDDEDGEDLAEDYGSFEDQYSGTSIKLINFVMTKEEFETIITALEVIGERENLASNADVVLWLLEEYEVER